MSTTESTARITHIIISNYNDGKNPVWCKFITATTKDGVIKARCPARAAADLFDGHAMRTAGCNLHDMEELSDEAGNLFKSGLLSTDMTQESFLLFYEVRVMHEHWRKGLGHDTVQAVLKEVAQTLGGGYWLIVAPGYLDSDVLRESMLKGVSPLDDDKVKRIKDRQSDAARAFWKSLGVVPYKETPYCYGYVNMEGVISNNDSKKWCRTMKAIVRCPGPNGMGLSTGHHATADEMNVEETDLDSHFPNIYRLSQDPIFDSYICNGNILVFHEINLPDGDRRSEVEGDIVKEMLRQMLRKAADDFGSADFALAPPAYLHACPKRNAGEDE